MRYIFLFFCLFFFAPDAFAVKLQILHTNDLHGFFEHSIEDHHRGGYAALKAEIDKQKRLAAEKGVQTLVVDAGDFMEGSLFYLAKNGRRNFGIMNLMGYDAVAVGNHDWLMGTRELSKIVNEVNPRFAYLGANFKVNFALFPGLSKKVKEYKVFDIGGVKVAFMGITTDELFYKWRFEHGNIKDPVKTAKKVSKRIKKDGHADFVVALTHTGFLTDKKIVKDSKHVDLVVGGHSHTYLHKPFYQKNEKGMRIPIVQAGEHAKVLGKLVVEVEKGKPLEILHYELLPISDFKAKDEVVDDYVKEARKDIEDKFGTDWLSEKVGESEILLDSSVLRLTTWTAFITDGIKECMGGSQIAVHSPGFAGANIPRGKIDRELVFQAYPRIFDFEDKQGWHIYQVDVYGVFVKVLIKFILRQQYPVAFSGINFDLIDENGDVIVVRPGEVLAGGLEHPDKTWLGIEKKFKVKNLEIEGKKVKWFKKYKLAIPEGIVRGGYGISRFVKYILRNSAKGERSIWGCLNDKIRSEEVITGDYARRRREELGFKKTKSGLEYGKYRDYMFIPGQNSPNQKLKSLPGYTEKDLPKK